MTELSDNEILKRAELIIYKRRFDEQIKGLPKFLQGGRIANNSKFDDSARFYVTDVNEITHEVDVAETCVYFREIRGDSYPFIIIHKPDPSNTPEGYNTGIYIPDHLHVAISWGNDGKKGDVKVIIDSDEFPIEVILRDSEKNMTHEDERKNI